MSPLPVDLVEVYRRTEYQVADGSYAFTMRIDEPSDSLRTCHFAHGVDCSAFITACNPRSVPRADAENAGAMMRLAGELESRGYFVLDARGVDPTGAWPGEPSFLVLGITEPDAVAVARSFDQHAIVCAGDDATPRLVIVSNR
jgi:hypothetical protein